MTDINELNNVKVSNPKSTEALLKLGKLLQKDNVSTVEVLTKDAIDKMVNDVGITQKNDFSLDKEKLEVLRGGVNKECTQAKFKK